LPPYAATGRGRALIRSLGLFSFGDLMAAQAFLEFKTRPISTNALYRAFTRGKRVTSIKSAAYRKFIEEAGAELLAQRPGHVPGAYGVKIILISGWRGDVDNAAKAFLDLLAAHGVTDNDRNCMDLHVKRGKHDVTQIWVISTKDLEP